MDEDNAADVAAVCHRLAGLPLALELAATRAGTLGPRVLLDRLGEALDRGAARDLPARQRTMRATMDWSLRLLDPTARRLLPWLSVFVGGFNLDAAEWLAAVGPAEALPALEALVDASLVLASPDGDGGVVYSLLEPIRQYAADLLREAGQQRTAAGRHAGLVLTLLEQGAPNSPTREQVQWVERPEWLNVNASAALVWALADGDADTAARIGWAQWVQWWMRGRLEEGRRGMTTALGLPLRPPVRARAQIVVACMCYAQGDFAAAEDAWRAGLTLARQHGDLEVEAYSVAGLGLVAISTGDLATAADRFGESMSLAERAGEEWLLALTSIWLGTVVLAGGDVPGATDLFERGLASGRRRRDRLVTYIALLNMAQAESRRGDLAAAEGHLKESVLLSRQTGDAANLAFTLDGLAVIAAARRQWRRCALLTGAAAGMRTLSDGAVHNYYLPDEERRAAAEAGARAALGDDICSAVVDEGRRLGLAGAADAALTDGGRGRS